MFIKVEFDFSGIGNKNMYLMYYEELEFFFIYFFEIECVWFWMIFGDVYIMYVKVL